MNDTIVFQMWDKEYRTLIPEERENAWNELCSHPGILPRETFQTKHRVVGPQESMADHCAEEQENKARVCWGNQSLPSRLLKRVELPRKKASEICIMVPWSFWPNTAMFTGWDSRKCDTEQHLGSWGLTESMKIAWSWENTNSDNSEKTGLVKQTEYSTETSEKPHLTDNKNLKQALKQSSRTSSKYNDSQ